MNRHYDTAFYRDLVKRIRENFDNAAITTDIMVGFAGESEEEFTKSLNFAKEIGFASAHVFAYSRREGTVAYNMKNQVDKTEKSRRSKLMIEATLETQNKFLDDMVGKTCTVLFESKDDFGYYHGFSENYCPVKIKSDENLTGKILKVEIQSRQNNMLIGK
jgi:threonylcarbamoyladenosine tRNA methylthiotransferase MtaB